MVIRFNRRQFLKSLGAAAAGLALPGWALARLGKAQRKATVVPASGYRYFTAAEVEFVDAVVSRLIPADELGPGAKEAGVTTFIDRQLAGAYGRAQS